MTDMQDSSGCNLGEINPFRYRGYYYDEDTGWYYLQSRYYDAEIGRFLNADDVHYLGDETLSCNLFTYCKNEPINKSDGSGNVWYRSVKFVAGVINGILFLSGIGISIVRLKNMGKAGKTQLVNSIKKRLQINAYTLSKKIIKKTSIKGAAIGFLKTIISTAAILLVVYITCFQSIGGLIALAWDCADIHPLNNQVDKVTRQSVKKISSNFKRYVHSGMGY